MSTTLRFPKHILHRMHVRNFVSTGVWSERRGKEDEKRIFPIQSEAELDALMSQSTWTIEQLLPKRKRGQHHEISPEFLRQLLRRSGLQLPKSAEQEKHMLLDLQRQLAFVDHVQDVNTKFVKPLSRIGEDGLLMTWEGLHSEEGDAQLLDLAEFKEKMARAYFYVKDESAKRNDM
ncbi:uncharacterized protein V1518DRAFT_412186 [Limtongia smithiae]|uniref:uncharacterized protein n=1 Tax=Limtongia smithiae TaxID=1125753 RepID=UPI0034CEF834